MIKPIRVCPKPRYFQAIQLANTEESARTVAELLDGMVRVMRDGHGNPIRWSVIYMDRANGDTKTVHPGDYLVRHEDVPGAGWELWDQKLFTSYYQEAPDA